MVVENVRQARLLYCLNLTLDHGLLYGNFSILVISKMGMEARICFCPCLSIKNVGNTNILIVNHKHQK